MERFSERIQDQIPRDFFTDADIANLIPGSADRRYALVKRAIAGGQLLHIRRGLYFLAPRYRRGPANLFVVAQILYGPSYISFESALSHHDWIPEAVRTITSATSRRSRDFDTPLGRFRYSHIPCSPFLVGVVREVVDKESFWVAQPWKAIADYVYSFKKDWTGIDPLLRSLRIEEENLKETRKETLLALKESYRSRRVLRFLRGVERNLGL
jgi:predicted transcriptional regulator of viral defense system